MDNKKKGMLIVVSGPSGSGKGTVLKELIKRNPKIKISVSATTRQKRSGEQHAKDYYFLERNEFINLIENDNMIEYAEYCGNFYGTPRKSVEENLEKGNDVILEIEVDGAMQVLKKYPQALSIFILPPSLKILKERLINRGTENQDTLEKRLEKAKQEINSAKYYDFLVINDIIEKCCEQFEIIINDQKLKNKKNLNLINEVLYDK